MLFMGEVLTHMVSYVIHKQADDVNAPIILILTMVECSSAKLSVLAKTTWDVYSLKYYANCITHSQWAGLESPEFLK